MHSPLQYLGQIVFFGIVAAGTGYLASNPVYNQVAKDTAQIKLSFAHGAERKVDCRRLTAKEIAELPPAERRPNTCSRERIAMHVQLEINGELLYDDQLEPTGLASDGPAQTYKKFLVPAGTHTLVARLRDTKRADGFDYETTKQVNLAPWQNLAIDFRADVGGFTFR